jgi:hypothetical protein
MLVLMLEVMVHEVTQMSDPKDALEPKKAQDPEKVSESKDVKYTGKFASRWDLTPMYLESITRKSDGGFEVRGRANTNEPMCADMLESISGGVPLELTGLICECGSSWFNFAIRSVEAVKSKKGDWKFILDVNCGSCKKPGLLKSLQAS